MHGSIEREDGRVRNGTPEARRGAAVVTATPPRMPRWRPARLEAGRTRTVVACVVAIIVGAVLGTLLAQDRAAEAAPWLRAWISDARSARNALATMLGVQTTLVTIVLSSTALMYQSLASQYTPRLLGLISPAAALYREIPLFVLSSAYTAAGVRELGLATSGEAPRPVVVGGLLLLILALASVLTSMTTTFERLQVEEVVRRARHQIMAAARRLEHAPNLRAHGASPERTKNATAIAATRSGYVVGFDLTALDRLARRHRLVVRFERIIGGFVTRDEELGWFSGAAPSEREALSRALARTVVLGRRRTSFLDVGFGLHVLADIANRGLSPGINDPTTAQQALHQARAALLALIAMPLGDAALVDDGGQTIVSIALPRFRDYLNTALDGPSRYGAADGDVVNEILGVAQALGLAARSPEHRALARAVAARAVADATHRGELAPSRLRELQAEQRRVEEALNALDAPASDGPQERSPESPRRRRGTPRADRARRPGARVP